MGDAQTEELRHLVPPSGLEPAAHEVSQRGDEPVVLFDLSPVTALTNPVQSCVGQVLKEPEPRLEFHETVFAPMYYKHVLRDACDVLGGQRPRVGRVEGAQASGGRALDVR